MFLKCSWLPCPALQMEMFLKEERNVKNCPDTSLKGTSWSLCKKSNETLGGSNFNCLLKNSEFGHNKKLLKQMSFFSFRKTVYFGPLTSKLSISWSSIITWLLLEFNLPTYSISPNAHPAKWPLSSHHPVTTILCLIPFPVPLFTPRVRCLSCFVKREREF